MSLITQFYQATNLIKDKELSSFVSYFLHYKTNPKFFLVPSSSTGKYHPPEDNGEGGLARHTLKAVQIAICLTRLYELSQDHKDIVIAAVVLHDTYKNCQNTDSTTWSDRTNYKHGEIGANAIRESSQKLEGNCYSYINNKTLKKIHYVARLVEKHMSNWAKPKTYKARRQNLLERIVIEADYLASRKNVSFIVENLLEDN